MIFGVHSDFANIFSRGSPVVAVVAVQIETSQFESCFTNASRQRTKQFFSIKFNLYIYIYTYKLYFPISVQALWLFSLSFNSELCIKNMGTHCHRHPLSIRSAHLARRCPSKPRSGSSCTACVVSARLPLSRSGSTLGNE